MSNPVTDSQKPQIELREIEIADLNILFSHQQDTAAVHMAAFTAKDPADRTAFDAHWQRITADKNVTIRTILFNQAVIGHIASFVMSGNLEVTYWIDRAYWGKGLATQALKTFLANVMLQRPIYGRAAKDNFGSIRVLEKCGFVHIGEKKGFANARGREILEVLLRLDK